MQVWPLISAYNTSLRCGFQLIYIRLQLKMLSSLKHDWTSLHGSKWKLCHEIGRIKAIVGSRIITVGHYKYKFHYSVKYQKRNFTFPDIFVVRSVVCINGVWLTADRSSQTWWRRFTGDVITGCGWWHFLDQLIVQVDKSSIHHW